jgi:D-alanyl-D-alanine dipeptidase
VCCASTDDGAIRHQNRLVMIKALTAVGMANYPTEWWHWSYGDRYWALAAGAAAAHYGSWRRG